jgi:hypothetical protein
MVAGARTVAIWLIEIDPYAMIPIGGDGLVIKRQSGCRYATELSTGEFLADRGSFRDQRAWIDFPLPPPRAPYEDVAPSYACHP